MKWSWEQRVPELDSPGIQRTVFVLPAVKNKNRQARVVVLNDRAQAIVEKMRGQHPVYVFTWVNEAGVRDRIGRIRNTGWVNARRRAAQKYPAVFNREAPVGFRDLRAHDLIWCALTGSNRRHSPCKGDALPAELSAHPGKRNRGVAKTTPAGKAA